MICMVWGLIGLYDEVSPYVYNVGLVGYLNEGPTWVTYSLLKSYVKCNVEYVIFYMKWSYGCMTWG